MLTNISVGYENNDFISEILFPSVPVNKQSDKYFVHEKTGFTPLDDIRAPKTQANEIPPRTLSRDSYYAEEHALVDLVSPQEIANADAGLEPLMESTEEVTATILLNRENAAQTLARTAANYDTGHTVTLAGTDQWSDPASTPIADLKAARDQIHSAIYRKPNVAAMGYQVFTQLEDHADFIERIKYSQRGITTAEIVAAVVDIPRIVVAGAVKNTANVGQAITTSYLWGKDVIIAHADQPGRRKPVYGAEFTWRYRPAGGAVMPTERWFDDDLEAWKIRVRRAYDFKLLAVDAVATGQSVAGYLIVNAVA